MATCYVEQGKIMPEKIVVYVLSLNFINLGIWTLIDWYGSKNSALSLLFGGTLDGHSPRPLVYLNIFMHLTP